MNAESAIAAELPRWALMWLLAGALFLAGKVAVLWSAGLRGRRLAGFSFGWVGMDAAPFRTGSGRKKADLSSSLTWPLANVILGAVLLWGMARCFAHPLAAGWVGMMGLILVLHFGVFAMLAALWHAHGIAVAPIMRCPVAATSLAEFWGRRWNLAFRDLAHRFVFTPVARRFGNHAAMWTSFAVSGLAHELVISVPAGAGYGWPTAYFLLQALGVTLERKADTPRRRAAMKTDRSVRLTSWLRTHAFTVMPVFLLFHPPFVERVMVPFFNAIGALP